MNASDPEGLDSLIGKGAQYEGTLVFEYGTRIDGRLKGSVIGKGTLVIGEGAEVDADIRVGSLIVLGGTLRGKVVASNSIELLRAAVVHADLDTPDLFIEKGARFEGKSRMGETRTHDIESDDA